MYARRPLMRCRAPHAVIDAEGRRDVAATDSCPAAGLGGEYGDRVHLLFSSNRTLPFVGTDCVRGVWSGREYFCGKPESFLGCGLAADMASSDVVYFVVSATPVGGEITTLYSPG